VNPLLGSASSGIGIAPAKATEAQPALGVVDGCRLPALGRVDVAAEQAMDVDGGGIASGINTISQPVMSFMVIRPPALRAASNLACAGAPEQKPSGPGSEMRPSVESRSVWAGAEATIIVNNFL